MSSSSLLLLQVSRLLGDVGEGLLRIDDLDERVPLLGLLAQVNRSLPIRVLDGDVRASLDELLHAHRVADGDGVHERGPAVAVRRVEIHVFLDQLRAGRMEVDVGIGFRGI